MSSSKIAIIAGAGPAGLTAAYELLKRTDIQPIVLEATDMIGGIAQTFNYKGNRIDIGGHRFFSKSQRVTDWWFSLLPPQGKPAADTLEKGHEIDYAAEVIVEYLCRDCAPADGVTGEDMRHETRDMSDKVPQVSKLKSQVSALNSQSPDRTSPIMRVTRPAPDPQAEDLVMLQRPRLSRIFYRRHFFPYPIAITLTVARRLGLGNTFLIGMSYIKRKIFPLRDETYLDAFYRNRFGDRLYRTFFEAYTEKVWGVPCSQIRADWGAQRVKGLSLKRAVTHAVKDLLSSDFKKAQAERETSLITRFWYPKYGPGQMWETAAERIRACGGEVRMRKRVAGVRLTADRVTSVTVEDVDSGEKEEILCDYFFSTMPVKHLIGMMTPAVPADVVRVAEGLSYRDFMTVGLLLSKLHVEEKGKQIATSVPDNWIYIQEGDVRVGRVQVFNNWSPYMVADRENTVWIGLEYFVREGDDLWVKPDPEMIDLGITELGKIGFLRKEDVLDACVLRMKKAYPAYIGTYTELPVIQEFVDGIQNLFLIGRNGMHRYNNQDHSMLTAMLAVDNIVSGRTDKRNLWEVNMEGDYHEEKNNEAGKK